MENILGGEVKVLNDNFSFFLSFFPSRTTFSLHESSLQCCHFVKNLHVPYFMTLQDANARFQVLPEINILLAHKIPFRVFKRAK
jgi:hypothetical protein